MTSPESRYLSQEVRSRQAYERKALTPKGTLSERQIASIRSDRADGVPVDVLSKRFGVSEEKIRAVSRVAR